jgi:hypothetical protein
MCRTYEDYLPLPFTIRALDGSPKLSSTVDRVLICC